MRRLLPLLPVAACARPPREAGASRHSSKSSLPCEPTQESSFLDAPQQHSVRVASGAPRTVDPVGRYLHYEEAFLAGELDPAFEHLSTWDDRMVVDGEEPDETLAWGREMLRNHRPDHVHLSDDRWRHVAIVRTDVRHGSQENEFDRDELLYFQNILMNGAVCGRRAFFGRFILRAFGIPTTARPQRGHAALVHWTADGWVPCLGAGRGSGWTKSRDGQDLDLLATPEARALGEPYLEVERAQWIGDVVGEQRTFGLLAGEPDSWNAVALDRQRALLDGAEPEALAAVGVELAEANESSVQYAVEAATVTDADRRVVVDEDGVLRIPAATRRRARARSCSCRAPSAASRSTTGATAATRTSSTPSTRRRPAATRSPCAISRSLRCRSARSAPRPDSRRRAIRVRCTISAGSTRPRPAPSVRVDPPGLDLAMPGSSGRPLDAEARSATLPEARRSMRDRWIPWIVALALVAPACQTPGDDGASGPATSGAEGAWDADAVYEIRSYHFEPALLDAYRAWAEGEAVPYLARELDVVGFWTATSDPADVGGAPLDELGTANVTWVIRWDDLAQRNEVFPAVTSTPEFRDIFSRVPGGAEGYRRTEARFAEAVTRPVRAGG